MPANEEYGFECTLCRTRLYARPSQIGQRIVCPDCHTANVAPPPKPRAKKAEIDDSDTDFALSEVVDRPQATVLPPGPAPSGGESPSTLDAGERTWLRENPIAVQAQILIAKAKVEAKAEAEEFPTLTEGHSFVNLVSFLGDARVIIRALVLALMGYSVVFLLADAVASAGTGAFAQIFVLFELVVLGVLSWAFLVVSCVTGLTVLQDTANGYRKIENWPGLNLGEWLVSSFYIINDLFVVMLPAVLFATVCSWIWIPYWVSLLPAVVLLVLAFPVILLSMLEANSCLIIYSPVIWRSWSSARPLWRDFYVQSSVLAIAGLVAGTVLYASRSSFFMGLIAAAFLATAELVYFRMLGQLAFRLAERLPQEEPQSPPET